MNNKDGKAIIVILILLIIILASLFLWYLAIMKHFGLGGEPADTISPSPGQTDTPPSGADTDPDDPDPDDTSPDDPDPDDTQGSDPNGDMTAPRDFDITLLDISKEHPDIHSELNKIAAQYKCAAVSLVVYDTDTGEYFTFEYGNANIETKQKVTSYTKFRIASLSKLITALCVLTLIDEGFVSLDTDVSNYFGYEVKNSNFPETPITVRMLMNHTSSIFDSGAFLVSRDRESSESVRHLLERGSSFRRNRPGTVFEYSNFGYAVLGSLCERVSGKSLDAYAREKIFNPLGIDAAFVPHNLYDTSNIAVLYDDSHSVVQSVSAQLAVRESDTPGHDLHLAHANLTISAVDYAKILVMLGNGGIFDDVKILSSELIEEIHNADVEGASYQQGLATRYSVGDFLPREGFYWHTGSSYGTFAQYVYKLSPNRGVVVITTGAAITRLPSGMIDACTDLSKEAWKVLQ